MNEVVFGDRSEKTRKWDRTVILALCGVVLLVCALGCGIVYLSYPPVTAEQVSAVTDTEPPGQGVAAAVSQEQLAPDPIMDELQLELIGWGVGILLAGFVFYKAVIETGFWKVLLAAGAAVLVVVGLFWILLYRGGDVSTSQARDENLQVVKVVQPSGDPVVDEVYAGVNRENAGTNVVNAGGVSIYIVLFMISLIVVVAVVVFLHYYIKK